MAIFFPGMLTKIAKEAGLKVPKDPDGDEWDRKKYYHFDILCYLTLGRPLNWGHWREVVSHNAKLLKKFSFDELSQMTVGNLVDAGLRTDL